MEKLKLKDQLKEIKINNYAVPQGVNPFLYCTSIMEYLGDVDGEMRDELVYHVIVNWILTKKLSVNETVSLLDLLIKEGYLIDGIGDINDSVFKRSYSILIIGCIIYQNGKYLSESKLKETFNQVLEAFRLEKDLRGYVEGKSFAHSAAHGADAIAEFVKYNILDKNDLLSILGSIKDKISVDYYGYYHFEDERMISIVEAILKRELLSKKEIIAWVQSFNTVKPPENYNGIDYQAYMLELHNIVMFMKSLYFRLKSNSENLIILTEVETLINDISLFAVRNS